MWVFVYGSLMWGDWATRFQGINRGIAKLKGYHRAFNKKSTSNWGTRDAPCPTLGLEESSNEECVGLVFEFDEDQRHSVEAKLKKREGPSFQLSELEVELENGQKVTALTPVNQTNKWTYIKDTELNTLIDGVKSTSGEIGSYFEYIKNLFIMCKKLEIQDEYIQKMWELINKDAQNPEEV